MKSGVPFESPHVARQQSEANGAAPVTVIDAVDQRRQFLAPAGVGGEQGKYRAQVAGEVMHLAKNDRDQA